MKIGDFVTYTWEDPVYNPRSDKGPELIDFPALIYKIIKFNTTKSEYIVGLYVFTDNGIKQMRSVAFNDARSADTWR